MSISKTIRLRIAKWGNSLAIRLPAPDAEQLGGQGARLTLRAARREARSGFAESAQAPILASPDEATIGKWGNSLALRIPQRIVAELKLQEGDEMTLNAWESGFAEVARLPALSERFAQLRALRGSLPADFKFDRDEANSRGPDEQN